MEVITLLVIPHIFTGFKKIILSIASIEKYLFTYKRKLYCANVTK